MNDYHKIFDAWEAGGVDGMVIGPLTFDSPDLIKISEESEPPLPTLTLVHGGALTEYLCWALAGRATPRRRRTTLPPRHTTPTPRSTKRLASAPLLPSLPPRTPASRASGRSGRRRESC